MFKSVSYTHLNPYVKEVSDNYVRFTELFGKKEVDMKLMEATSYAPVQFIKELCDFEGKDFNIKMRVMTDLFNQKKYDEAFAEVERLKVDPSIDQHKFVKLLAFYVRVSPEYSDKDLPYETLINKVRGLRSVSYTHLDVYKRQEYVWSSSYDGVRGSDGAILFL